MVLDFIESFIRSFGINLCIGYCFIKIIDHTSMNTLKKVVIVLISILLSIINNYLKIYLSPIFTFLFIYLIYNLFFCILIKCNYGYSLIIIILSISVSCIIHFSSSTIISALETLLNLTINTSILFIIVSIFDLILAFRFFKIKRFKNGFQFIKNKEKNDYLDIFILIISLIIIYMYFMLGNYHKIHPKYLSFEFIISSIIMLLVIQKIFILYQKQKLLEKTLKEYESEIKEKNDKIDQMLKEENKLIKANHEFYHRQEALKHKLLHLEDFCTENFNEEYGEIVERIDLLSEQYKSIIKNSKILHKLPKSDISEIDDMFNYMQSECDKNNIEFVLKINGNIHSLINNIISKNRLETLIGDLIRNAIIAINYSHKEYRSITTILGIKDKYYEFCVYDSGIEFQKETLLKLGLENATTHKDNGGTGIGYITTFETLQACRASLIINELKPNTNNYTKSIIIRFDEKNEYIINTYRFSELNEIVKNRNNIIINSYPEQSENI